MKPSKITIICTVILMLILIGQVQAQQLSNSKISGKLTDSQDKPLDYASVTLLKAKDSAVVKTTLTDVNGNFDFENLPKNNYRVAAVMVGYGKVYSKVFTIDENHLTVKLEPIKLSPEAKNLQEVSVTAQKPLIELQADKMVMNVAGSIVATGNNAMEILEKAPGVTVDKDDNISLKGKQGVTVQIDGKQTYLSASQLAAFLRGTDGNTIESIEIITNPSAKYDAAGTSGIINIKLKKNKSVGTNGSFTVGAGYGQTYKSNTSLNINHKEGRWNFFGTFGYSNNKRTQDIGINRVIVNQDTTTRFDQLSAITGTRKNANVKAGIDFNSSNKNTIGIVFNGNLFNGNDGNVNNTLVEQQAPNQDYRINTLSDNKYDNNNFSLNLNERYQIDTSGRELAADVDFSRFNNSTHANYDNYYYNPDGSDFSPSSFLKNILPSQIKIKTAKVDYTHPFSKTFKLETGLKASDVRTDNDLQYKTLQQNNWVNDPSKSNHFIYQENIYAGYITLSKSFKKLSVQAGLRAEETHSDGNSITELKQVKREYLDWFPSVFTTYQFSDNHSIGLNYSKRVDRPSYEDLNPFAFYLDPYTYEQGNSFLNPQYTHSFELSYTYKKRYIATLNYSHTNDVIAEVMRQDDTSKVTYVTRDNLNRQTYYSLNLNFPVTFTKWWSSNNNINTFFLGFKSPLLGAELDNGQVTTNIYTNQSFTITPGFRAELSGYYQSPLTYSVYHISGNWSLEPGISKTFANKKATLKFSVSDIFNTRKQKVTTNYQNLNVLIDQKRESRVARISFTYNFGNTKLNIQRHESGAQDEKSRVKSDN